MGDDDVKILAEDIDDDSAIFQTEQDQLKLKKELLGLHQNIESDDDEDIETTIQIPKESAHPLWKKLFG